MAITQQQHTAVIKLVTGMFDAAPGAVYLGQLTGYVEAVSGAAPGVEPIRSLANALTATAAFQSLYPPFLTDNQFATRFIDRLLGDAVGDSEAMAWAVSWINGLLASGMSRGDVIYDAIAALDPGHARVYFVESDADGNITSGSANNDHVARLRFNAGLVGMADLDAVNFA
jgi:hypothetical protein